MTQRNSTTWILKVRQKLKILFLIAIAGFFSRCEKYSSVKIIDENFLQALIERGVDKDGDGTISFREAADIKELNIYYCDIFDLTGLEWFINLETLRCGDNDFTEIDVSQNKALKYLDIEHNKVFSLDVSNNVNLETLITMYNPLTSLDISKNTALKCLINQATPIKNLDISNNILLKELDCSGNGLSALDISKNHALEILNCIANRLESLDASHNPALKTLQCDGNNLSTLDLSGNKLISQLYLNWMPSLTRVCVWQTPFPTLGVYVEYAGSPNVYFTTDCSK